METLLWILIAALFGLSLIGVFLPVLPDTLLLWAGFLVYQFGLAEPGAGLPASFWWGMAGLSVLIFGSDLLTNAYFVKKYGGSKWSPLAAVAGVVLGVFVLPPIGMLVFPFVFVLAVEMGLEKRPWEKALRTAAGALVAFFSSALVKLVLQAVMIGWFFLAI